MTPDPAALAKVLYETAHRYLTNLGHDMAPLDWPAAADERGLYMAEAEAALRALAPASEVGDWTSIRQVWDDAAAAVDGRSNGPLRNPASIAGWQAVARHVASLLAAERTAALERAAQVAEENAGVGWLASDPQAHRTACQNIARDIRALLPRPASGPSILLQRMAEEWEADQARAAEAQERER